MHSYGPAEYSSTCVANFISLLWRHSVAPRSRNTVYVASLWRGHLLPRCRPRWARPLPLRRVVSFLKYSFGFCEFSRIHASGAVIGLLGLFVDVSASIMAGHMCFKGNQYATYKYVCMHIKIYNGCEHKCIYIYIHVWYGYIHLYTYALCGCLTIAGVSNVAQTQIHVHMYICMYMYIYVCIYMYMHVCNATFVYMHIHTHVTYIYIYV